MDKSGQDNRSNQLNSNNDSYWQSRGDSSRPSDWSDKSSGGGYGYSKSDNDNRSNQMNPNNDAYYSSRGASKK